MLDLAIAAITEFLLEKLPETRRGRIVLWTCMAATVALGVAALVVTLSD